MSAAYGSYMASSSNLRYQILAGLVEERGIEVMFKSNPAACAVLSFIVRCVAERSVTHAAALLSCLAAPAKKHGLRRRRHALESRRRLHASENLEEKDFCQHSLLLPVTVTALGQRLKPPLPALPSFPCRTGNTFLGSLLWVDYIRLLGLQKAGGGH